MSDLRIEIHPGLGEIDADAWDALAGDDDPFAEHAFLKALETSGSVGDGTGWQPCHVTVWRDRDLIAALPLYAKGHSYGEFIFDFGWAQAAYRAGLEYYPKLVSMTPLTPATGTRLLIHPREPAQEATAMLLDGVEHVRRELRASSSHLLFLNPDEHARVTASGAYASRETLQFHWRNRDGAPYASFDDYLATFRSEQRKQTRKERARARGHGLRIVVRQGPELDDDAWRALAMFYESTCDRKGSEPYLTPRFFEHLRASRACARVVAVLAYDGERIVAGTLNFEKGKHLYGRYWGALREYDCLHFELCYHVLVERAIERRLHRVEAGAQGIHKLKRGFSPAVVYSAHRLAHKGLHDAVARFVEIERAETHAQKVHLEHDSPYHRAHEPGASA